MNSFILSTTRIHLVQLLHQLPPLRLQVFPRETWCHSQWSTIPNVKCIETLRTYLKPPQLKLWLAFLRYCCTKLNYLRCFVLNNLLFLQFLNSTQERTKVVVEQLCWVSRIVDNPTGLHASLRRVAFGNRDLYACYCSKESSDGSALCNIYVRECPLTTVYASVS